MKKQDEFCLNLREKALHDLFGLNGYEAKALVFLLFSKEKEVKAQAIAEGTGIPRSRVYDALDGLLENRLITEKKGWPSTFSTTPQILQDELIDRQSNQETALTRVFLQKDPK